MNSYKIALVSALAFISCSQERVNQWESELSDKKFTYTDVSGIGFEDGVTRRDPSDVIKVGDTYYVYYTKVIENYSGYFGRIWCAKSTDEGYNWQEVGMVLDVGQQGAFDSFAVFTPNIIFAEGKYYLYYTGVQPTPTNSNGEFENNSVNDYTALGVAVSDRPDSGFERINDQPILRRSQKEEEFDSYRIDDASLLYRDGKYWLYYKGRCFADGKEGPRKTKMGVAWSDSPAGPFTKHSSYIQPQGHEVLIFPCNGKVYSLASLSSTIEMAADGIDFTTAPLSLKVDDIPFAPGAYRAELTNAEDCNRGLEWGVAIKRAKRDLGLQRYSFE